MNAHDYVLDPNSAWHEGGERPYSHGVQVFARDLLERRNGVVIGTWRSGAHKVTAPGHRTRTFIGETSWSDAERLADDYELAIRYAK